MMTRVLNLVCVMSLLVVAWVPVGAEEAPAKVSGALMANGEKVELPYAYAIELEKGFYDPTDPAWKLVFVDRPIAERDLDGMIWEAAFVELEITLTSEFDDEAELQVYAQNMRLTAGSGGNLSGGTYPELEIETTGPERIVGRVFHPQAQEFFDDTYQYDFTFDLPFSDPDAPIGDPLPAGGGAPGEAYLAWVKAIHAGDIQGLKKLVPPEMAAELDGPEAAEGMEFMKLMTPTEVKVLGGSSDGQTAILQVEGVMDGERAQGEITLEQQGGLWMAVSSSW